MKIVDVKGINLLIPLDQPVRLGNLAITHRDVALAIVETQSGMRGVGMTLTRDGDVAGVINRHLAPLLIGADADEVEMLWQKMYQQTRYIGRKGMVMRAISAIDIALWDVKSASAHLPLFRYLGGSVRPIPSMVAGGYYREQESIDKIAEEMARYKEEGFKHAKMMIGGASEEEDLARIKHARNGLGSGVSLGLDVNGAWVNVRQGMSLLQKANPSDISFIEEPFYPEYYPMIRSLAQHTSVPIALGEDESLRWSFRDMVTGGEVAILRPDATVIGGISEWVKLANIASAWSKEIIPHYFPHIHIHMASLYPSCSVIEVISERSGIMPLEKILLPLPLLNGQLMQQERHGIGWEFDWEAVRFYQKDSGGMNDGTGG